MKAIEVYTVEMPEWAKEGIRQGFEAGRRELERRERERARRNRWLVRVGFGLLLLLALAGLASAEYPTVNLPPSLRQENWGTGSCVHASLISLLRWQGRHNTAAYWRAKYEGGESFNGLTAKLDAEKQRYAAGFDVAFLEWACRTRRGAVITWDVANGYHSVAVVHLDDKLAGILDNNDIGRIHWFPREAFLAHWQISGSWAVTPVYTPAPPLPQ